MKKWNEFRIKYEENGQLVTMRIQTGASIAEIRREYSAIEQQEATGVITKKLVSIEILGKV